MDEKLGENKKIDVTMLVLKQNDYRDSVELELTLGFIQEFLEGIQSDNTILVLTHCDQQMPSSSFVADKLRKLKQSNFDVKRDRVFYFEGNKNSIKNI